MTKKIVWVLVSCLMVASLVLAACAPAAPEEEKEEVVPTGEEQEVFKWKIQGFVPAAHPAVAKSQGFFCDTVRKLSGGRLDISSFGAGEIVEALEVTDAVGAGVLEMGSWWPAYDIGKDPVAALFGCMPFGFTMNDYMTWYYEAGGKDLIEEFYNRYNIHVMGCYASGAQIMGHFREPVKSLADMKGKVLRSSGIQAEIYERVGMTTTVLSAGEQYTAMERGIIDMAEFSTPSFNYLMGYHEVGPYIMVPGWHEPASLVLFVVNMDDWNELPDDLKYICEVATMAVYTNYRHYVLWDDAVCWGKMMDEGSEYAVLPDADKAALYDAAQEVLDEYAAKDEFYAQVLKSARDFLATIALYKDLCDLSFER